MRPDSGRQQLYSCVANAGLHREVDIEILAMVLNGADITEVFSPERVTRLCSKYGLVSGDSWGLRDVYDFSDPKTQAMVVKRVMDTEPIIVIGSPSCTMDVLPHSAIEPSYPWGGLEAEVGRRQG